MPGRQHTSRDRSMSDGPVEGDEYFLTDRYREDKDGLYHAVTHSPGAKKKARELNLSLDSEHHFRQALINNHLSETEFADLVKDTILKQGAKFASEQLLPEYFPGAVDRIKYLNSQCAPPKETHGKSRSPGR